MAGEGAPVALAGAAADGADLNVVIRAGSQAVEREATGIAAQAAVLPGANRTIRSDGGIPEFVALRVGNRFPELQQQLAGLAVEDADDERHGQRRLGVTGADCREPTGEQCGQTAIAIVFHITSQLPQQGHQGVALGFLD